MLHYIYISYKGKSMNKAYQTMRDFWLDVKNLQHKNEVPQLGPHKVCVAGVEISALDHNGVLKHFLIAASSLGNASIYFENNSPSGIGGMTGGATSGPVREKALRMLQAAAQVADKLPVVAQWQDSANSEEVILFVVSADGALRAVQLPNEQVRNPENMYYRFFAYSQQLLGAITARKYFDVKFNISNDSLDDVCNYLIDNKFCSNEPTVNKGSSFSQVNVMIPKNHFPEMLEGIKSFGASSVIRSGVKQYVL